MRKIWPWLLLFSGLLMLTFNWDHLRLKFTPLPEVVADHLITGDYRTVVFLYGGDQCTTCRAKRAIDTLKNRDDIVLVFEEEVSGGEIENFMASFMIKGLPVRGGSAVEGYLRRLAATVPTEQWRRNYLVDYDRKRLVSFSRF